MLMERRRWAAARREGEGTSWGGVGERVCVYLKRNRAGVAVGWEMDGPDGGARVGQVVVAADRSCER